MSLFQDKTAQACLNRFLGVHLPTPVTKQTQRPRSQPLICSLRAVLTHEGQQKTHPVYSSGQACQPQFLRGSWNSSNLGFTFSQMQVDSGLNSGMYASEMGSETWTLSSILKQPCRLITGPLSLRSHWYCWNHVVSAAVLLRCEDVTVISRSSERSASYLGANSNLLALGLGDHLVQPWTTIHEGHTHPAFSTQKDTEEAPSWDLRLGINHTQTPVFPQRSFLKWGRKVKVAAF